MIKPFREDVVYKDQDIKDFPEAYYLYLFKNVVPIPNTNLYRAERKEFKDNNLYGDITLTDVIYITEKEILECVPYAIEIRGSYYKIK